MLKNNTEALRTQKTTEENLKDLLLWTSW